MMKQRVLVFLVAAQLIALKMNAQSVSINTSGNAADTSAMLDISSNSKGVLIPRMTQAQRNAIYSPADGLLVYQTDGTKGVYYYHTGVGWTLLTSATNVWSLSGNSGTNAANFIGTTDQRSLRFRTNNTQGLMLDSLGNVNVGNSPVLNTVAPDKLLIDAGTAGSPTTSHNLITGKGFINNYLQINTQNRSSGTNASSDVVATADNGDETTNYVNMGINSSGNTANFYGGANDAYLYNLGQNLLIGTGTAGKVLAFLTGGGTQSTNERMRIDGSGNVGIGTNSPTALLDVNGTTRVRSLASGAATDSIVTADANGVLKRRSLSSVVGSTATTNTLTSSVNTMTNTTNGVAASASIVNSISNTSTGNNLSTTVNGVAGTAVPMVNSINNTSTGNSLTISVNGVSATAVNIVNSNTLTSTGNTLTNATNGVSASASIVNSISNTSTGNNLTTTVNGVAGTAVPLVNSNVLSLSGNTLTSTVNGVATTSPTVGTVSGSLSGNNLTVSVNGVNSSAINLGSLNAADSTTASNGVNLAGKDVRLGGALSGATTITTTGTNTLALAGLQSGAVADSVVVANATTGVLGRRSVSAIVNGSTTNTLSSSANTMTNTTNGVTATAPIVNTVSNSSTANNLTTTVNGVAGTAVPIVNSISNTSTGNNLTTTVNGVAGTAVPLVNSNALSLSGNTMTSTVNGVATTSPTVGTVSGSLSGNNLTVSVNGVNSSAINLGSLNAADSTTASNGVNLVGKDVRLGGALSGATTITTTGINTLALAGLQSGAVADSVVVANATTGVLGRRSVSAIVNGSTTNTLSSSANTMTNTTNGVSATAPIVNSVSNTSTGNNLTTIVNGVAGTAVPMVNSNTLASTGNTITNATNGVSASANIVNSISNTSTGNNLTTTVNGVAATAVPMVNSISNTSTGNNLTTTVNGVAGTAVPIVNSNALSLSGTNLTSTVNGVASASLDLSSAINGSVWSRTGNAGTTAATNFIGTTDAIDFVTRTNNTERMRVSSAGNVGIGTSSPSGRFHIAGGNQNNAATPLFKINDLNLSGTHFAIDNGQAANAYRIIAINSNMELQAGSNPNQLVLASGGGVGIGTGTPSNTLHVNGTARVTTLAGGAATDSLVTADANGVLNRRSVASVINGATTNTLTSSVNTMTNTTNGVAASANIVNSISNASSGNNLTTTVNGVAATAVPMVNSNTLSVSGTSLTSTVNGVASTAVSLPFITSINTLTSPTQTFATGTSGSDFNISSVGSTHTFNVPDAGQFTRGVITTGAQTFGGNKTFNGNIIVDGGASNDGTFNAGSAIRFGWSGSGEGIVSKRTAGGNSNGIDFLTASTSRLSIANAGNVGIGTTAPSNTLHVNGTARINTLTSGAVTDSVVTADATGVLRRRTVASLLAGGTVVSNTSSGNNLTTTVNGVVGTAVPMVNSISNASSGNTLTTTVNGVAGTGVNIINSNASSLSGTNLTTTVNGVAASAVDLTPAITARAWGLTGNSNTSSGSNFLGTTNNTSLRIRTNNVERVTIDSIGNVGFNTTTPTYRAHYAGGDANTSVGTPSSANMFAGYENTAGGATMCDIKTTNAGNTFILRWGINPVFTGGTTPAVPGMVGVGGWSGIYNGVVSQYLTYDFVNRNVILAPPGQINNVGVNTNTPNSNFSVGGSMSVGYRTTTGGITIGATDYVVINTGAGATWTLPAASTCAGRVYKLVNHGTGSISLSLSVTTGSSSTVSSLSNSSGSNTMEIISDGSVWRRID